MISYFIQDSQLDGEILSVKERTQWKRKKIINAIDELTMLAKNGLMALHWTGTSIRELDDSPITYHRSVRDEIKIYSQHYVGYFETNNVRIEIVPRLFTDDVGCAGNWNLFCLLLTYANGAHLAEASARLQEQQGGYSWPWLMAILWLAALEKGLSNNTIPKAYVHQTGNLNTVKGRIDFSGHIKRNLVNAAKQFCRYDELSFDVPINRAILRTTDFISEQKVPIGMLSEAFEHCNKLKSLRVEDIITPEEIDQIEFNELNESYRPAMALASIILSSSGAGSSSLGSPAMPSALFVDLASLWEEYIFNVLQRYLPSTLRIASPNHDIDRTFILEGQARPIRPDFLVYRTKDNALVGIIDAKYKDYRTFGVNAEVSKAVKIEDFYQMNTYLLHYGYKSTQPLTGIFVAPAKMSGAPSSNIHNYEGIANLRIGLCNLPVQDLLNSEVDAQKQFAQQIEDWLLDKG